MKRITILLLVAACFNANAQSAITLNASNFPSVGDTLRYTNVTLASVPNYTQTGANFNWDFSNAVYQSEGLREFKSALQTPYFLFFASFTGFAELLPNPPAIGPVSFTNYYDFYRKTTTPQNAYVADGVGLTFSNVPLPCNYTDRDELYIFPLTYPVKDSSTFRFSTPSTTLVPIRYTKTGYRITRVDGWGTVKTPYGTDVCLRLVTTQYAQDSIKNTIIPIPIGLPNYQRSYQWLTASSKIPFFEVSGNLIGTTFTPTNARYRGYQIKTTPPNTTGIAENTDLMHLQVQPNPVVGVLNVNGLQGDCILQLIDASGRVVKTASLHGLDTAQLETAGLSTGIYTLKVVNDKGCSSIKCVIQ